MARRAQKGLVITLLVSGSLLIVLVSVLLVVLVIAPVTTVREGRIELHDGRTERARADIKTLEAAVDAYAVEHGHHPETLVMLTIPQAGRQAALTPENLIDPWGRQYIYDPGQPHPATGRPKIYSMGAEGNPGTMISNW
jgi:hypothetical protein